MEPLGVGLLVDGLTQVVENDENGGALTLDMESEPCVIPQELHRIELVILLENRASKSDGYEAGIVQIQTDTWSWEKET